MEMRHLWLCVQVRQVCSAGDSPAEVRIRSLVAWMADRRATKYLKPINKAILGIVSESPGHNESERIDGLESANSGGRTRSCRVKAAWIAEN